MSVVARTHHSLSAAERVELLCQLDPFAWWHALGERRGFDATTVIGNGVGGFTALPRGHGKPWCWPLPLRCKREPEAIDVGPRGAR
jgi:hypothetical protein